MEKQPHASGSELLKQTSILDAIYWINGSWNEVDKNTILKCFQKCEFVSETETEESLSDDEQDDNIPLAALKMSREIFGCEFNELLGIDSTVSTCDTNEINWEMSGNDLLDHFKSQDSDSGSDDNDDNTSDAAAPISKIEASDLLTKLKLFGKHLGSSMFLESICKAEDELNILCANQCKQTNITDFFAAERN